MFFRIFLGARFPAAPLGDDRLVDWSVIARPTTSTTTTTKARYEYADGRRGHGADVHECNVKRVHF